MSQDASSGSGRSASTDALGPLRGVLAGVWLWCEDDDEALAYRGIAGKPCGPAGRLGRDGDVGLDRGEGLDDDTESYLGALCLGTGRDGGVGAQDWGDGVCDARGEKIGAMRLGGGCVDSLGLDAGRFSVSDLPGTKVPYRFSYALIDSGLYWLVSCRPLFHSSNTEERVLSSRDGSESSSRWGLRRLIFYCFLRFI